MFSFALSYCFVNRLIRWVRTLVRFVSMLRQRRVRLVVFVVSVAATSVRRAFGALLVVSLFSGARFGLVVFVWSCCVVRRSTRCVAVAALCLRSLIRGCFVELVATWSCRSVYLRGYDYTNRGVTYLVCLPLSSFRWVVSDRESPNDFVGIVSECVIRNFSSHRVMRYTCRARS